MGSDIAWSDGADLGVGCGAEAENLEGDESDDAWMDAGFGCDAEAWRMAHGLE